MRRGLLLLTLLCAACGGWELNSRPQHVCYGGDGLYDNLDKQDPEHDGPAVCDPVVSDTAGSPTPIGSP